MSTDKNKLKCLAYYRLACAVIAVGYASLIFGFTPKFFFNFLTNWGNVMLAFTYTLLAIAHFREGQYFERYKRTTKRSSLFWKVVVLSYECMMLMVCMITLGYWFAVLPTDLVLPDDVKKPNLDSSIALDL